MNRKVAKLISTGLYSFCTVVCALSFFTQWYRAGVIEEQNALMGMAAAFFGIAALVGVATLLRMGKESK